MAAEALLQEYGFRFVAELEAGLGAPLSGLATRDKRGRRLPLKIQIEDRLIPWTVTIRLRGDSPGVTCEAPDSVEVDMAGLPLFLLARAGGHGAKGREQGDADIRYAVSAYAESLGAALFSNFPAGAHYLPAARAGLLQSHRLVAAAMFQRSPLTGLGEVSMPSLSGVVADFVSEILLSEPRRGARFSKVASEIEDSVLRGRSGSAHQRPATRRSTSLTSMGTIPSTAQARWCRNSHPSCCCSSGRYKATTCSS